MVNAHTVLVRNPGSKRTAEGVGRMLRDNGKCILRMNGVGTGAIDGRLSTQ